MDLFGYKTLLREIRFISWLHLILHSVYCNILLLGRLYRLKSLSLQERKRCHVYYKVMLSAKNYSFSYQTFLGMYYCKRKLQSKIQERIHVYICTGMYRKEIIIDVKTNFSSKKVVKNVAYHYILKFEDSLYEIVKITSNMYNLLFVLEYAHIPSSYLISVNG